MWKGILLVFCSVSALARTGVVKVTFPSSVQGEILVSFVSMKSGKILFSKIVDNPEPLTVKLPTETVWFVCSARDKIGFYPLFYSTTPVKGTTKTVQCELTDTIEVKGKVVDKRRGTPVPGAKVGLSLFFKDTPPNFFYRKVLEKFGFIKEYLSTTDSKGNFRVRLPVARVGLSVKVEGLGGEVVVLDLRDKGSQRLVDIGKIEFTRESSITVYAIGEKDPPDFVKVKLKPFYIEGNKGIDPQVIKGKKANQKIIEFRNLEEGIYIVELELPNPLYKKGSLATSKTVNPKVALVLLEEGDNVSLDIPIIDKKLVVSLKELPIPIQYDPVVSLTCQQYKYYFQRSKLKKVKDLWKAEFRLYLPCKAQLKVEINPHKVYEYIDKKKWDKLSNTNTVSLGDIHISKDSPDYQEITPELPDNVTIALRTKNRYNTLSFNALDIKNLTYIAVSKDFSVPSNELQITLPSSTYGIITKGVVKNLEDSMENSFKRYLLKEVASTTNTIELDLQKKLEVVIRIKEHSEKLRRVRVCLYHHYFIDQPYCPNVNGKKDSFVLETYSNKFVITAIGRGSGSSRSLGAYKAMEYTGEPIELELKETGKLAVLSDNVVNLTDSSHIISSIFFICSRKERICQIGDKFFQVPQRTIITPTTDGKVALIDNIAPGEYYLIVLRGTKEIKSTNFTIREGELTLLRQLF